MNISDRSVILSGLALIALIALNEMFLPEHYQSVQRQTQPAVTTHIDLSKPLFLKDGSIACEDPKDLESLPFESEGFEPLDQGKPYKSCLEWAARRVRILGRKGEMLNMVDATIENTAGQDAWVLEDSLHN